MTTRALAIHLSLVATLPLTVAAQKPIKEDVMFVDGSRAPSTIAQMVGTAQIVLIARYSGDQRLRPDLKPVSPISSLYKFNVVEVIKSSTASLKPGDSIEIDLPGGIRETPTETVVTRVHGEERLIPKRQYVLFLNNEPWRSPGNYVKAWGNPGEGLFDISGNRVRPLAAMRQENRGTPTEEFFKELRRFKIP